MESENINEAQLVKYADTFHSVLLETANEYLPAEIRNNLLNLSFLPAHIVCFVSTSFGVAFEYHSSEATKFTSVRGSKRIEYVFTGAPNNIGRMPVHLSVGRENLVGFLTLQGGFPFLLRDVDSSLTLIDVAFQVGDWRREVDYAEVYGERRALAWSEAMAVARAKNLVLAALVELNRARSRQLSIDEYIQTHKARTVLVLGSYDAEGRERIRSITKVLTAEGYEPLTVDEVPDNPQQSLSQKVVALGSISRFVVVEDTTASGHIAELEICKLNQWTTFVLRQAGTGSSFMTAGSSLFSRVISEFEYNPPPIAEIVKQGSKWAEETIAGLETKLTETYPWRSDRNG
jgi:hypothetical protein